LAGSSLLVERAESREKRISASAVAEPSAPIASARSASPRRIASTPSWMAVAPEAQAAAEGLGGAVGDRAERGRLEQVERGQPARHFKQAVGIAVALAAVVERKAVVPVQFHRRRGEEQRPAEIVEGKARFGDRLVRGLFRQFVGEGGSALVARRQEIDHPGDAGAQLVHRKAGDRVDAGGAGGQRRPVVLFADAERRHHANAGDGDQRPAHMVLRVGHARCSQSAAQTSAMPSKW